MKVSISPNPSLDPDHPVEITAGFTTAVADIPDWIEQVTAAIDTAGRLIVAGAFLESTPNVRWNVTATGTVFKAVFDRLPGDAAALGAVGRVVLALRLPLVSLGVKGTTAARPERALPTLASALTAQPSARSQLAFGFEMDPGTQWLHVEVTGRGVIDPQTVQWIDEAAAVWRQACQAGALSDATSDFEVTPGDIGMDPAAVGADFWSAQAMYDEVALQAPTALLNMFDELARTKSALGHVSLT